MVNVGGRYSPSTGIFTADTSGLYYFEQYWLNDVRYGQYLYMWKNGVEQCRSFGGAGTWNAASCSAVMQLSVGDEVYVISDDGEPVFCPDCAGFTGFLITSCVNSQGNRIGAVFLSVCVCVCVCWFVRPTLCTTS